MSEYGPTVLSTKVLDNRKFSYEVGNISNRSDPMRSGMWWVFRINVLSSLDNIETLVGVLRKEAPERFGDVTVKTSRYTAVSYEAMAIGMPRMQTAPLSELRLAYNVYESPDAWIEAGAPESTAERLLGFPTEGVNLTLDDMLDLLLKGRPARSFPTQEQLTRTLEAIFETNKQDYTITKKKVSTPVEPEEALPRKRRIVRRPSRDDTSSKTPTKNRRVIRKR